METKLPDVYPQDSHCHQGTLQIQLVSDSQFLTNVLNRQTQYQTPHNFELVYSLVDLMHSVLKLGWYPPCLVKQLVHWRPRRWNTLADYCANVSASYCTDWRLTHPEMRNIIFKEGAFIQLHADGSLYTSTGQGAAAYSFTVLTKGQQGIKRQVVEASAIHLKDQTITTAETITIKINLERIIAITGQEYYASPRLS